MTLYKQIDIPHRNKAGYLIGSKRIRTKWVCPDCGETMGEPVKLRFREGTQTYWVDVWNNPCRHMATYPFSRQDRHKPIYLTWITMLMKALSKRGYTIAMCQDDTRDLCTLIYQNQVIGRLTCKMDFELLPNANASDLSIICHTVISVLGCPPAVEINRHELATWIFFPTL